VPIASHYLPKCTDHSGAGRAGRFALTARKHALLMLSIVLSTVLASSSVGYYHAVYLPQRDAELDQERALEETLAYARKRAAQVRSAAEQRELAQRRSTDEAAADGRYQTCLNSAGVTHDASWAAACKRMADKAVEDRVDCLAKSRMPEGYCAAVYRTRDVSPHCALPTAIVADLDGGLSAARKRCLWERQAALQ
jgi:hypothetical protein